MISELSRAICHDVRVFSPEAAVRSLARLGRAEHQLGRGGGGGLWHQRKDKGVRTFKDPESVLGRGTWCLFNVHEVIV